MKIKRFNILVVILASAFITQCNSNSIMSLLDGDFVDKTPPEISNVGVEPYTTINISFNETIDPESVEIVENYLFEPALAISSILLKGDQQSIRIRTEVQEPSQEYALIINGVKDIAGNIISDQANSWTWTTPPLEVDNTPPDIIQPVDGSRGLDLQTSVTWTTKDGAESYYISVWNKETGVHITGSPLEVDGNTNQIDLIFTEPVTYVCEISSDIMIGEPKAIEIHAMDDSIYVYCPDNEVCTNNGRVGNISLPFQTISSAINAAREIDGINIIKVADRGTQSYAGPITLLKASSLEGGYNSDFSQRDIAAFETEIRSESSFAIQVFDISDTETPTIFDGFTVYTGSQEHTYGAFILSSDNSVLISNNIFNASDSDGDSYGIYISSTENLQGGGPIIENNTFIGADQTSEGIVYGAYLYNSSATIRNNSIGTGTSLGRSYGIYVLSGTPTVSNNTITVEGGVERAYGIYSEDSDYTIADNDISVGMTDDTHYGINNQRSNTIMSGNTVVMESTNFLSIGVFCFESDISIIDSNITSGTPLTDNERSYAIYNDDCTGTISNSIITSGDVSAGVGKRTYGIASFDGGPYIISQNHVTGGNMNDGASYGILNSNIDPNTLIEYNEIFSGESPSSGISYALYTSDTGAIIKRNLIVSQKCWSGCQSWSLVNSDSDVIALGNTIIAGIAIGGTSVAVFNSGATGSIFMDNIIHSKDVGGTRFALYGPYDDANSGHNCVYTNGSAAIDYANGAVPAAGDCIEANSNELFISGPKGDYYLDVGSPAIDTGSDTAINLAVANRTTQIDGTLDDGIADMGFHYLP